MRHLDSLWLQDDVGVELARYLEEQSEAGNPVAYDTVINEAIRLWLKRKKGEMEGGGLKIELGDMVFDSVEDLREFLFGRFNHREREGFAVLCQAVAELARRVTDLEKED